MLDVVASATIVFREGFEAMLLTAMLTSLRNRGSVSIKHIISGISFGLLLTVLSAWLVSLMGINVERYGYVFSLATALVLTYVVTLNARVTQHVKEHVNDIQGQSGWVVGLAIAAVFLREGLEIVLMMYGLAIGNPLEALIGTALGIAMLVGLGTVMHRDILMRFGVGKTMLASNVILALMALFFYAEALMGYMDLAG